MNDIVALPILVVLFWLAVFGLRFVQDYEAANHVCSPICQIMEK